jgi:ribosomal protein S20
MSDSQNRKIVGYLKPQNHTFIKKYAGLYEISESQAVNHAVKSLQDTIPKDIKERIIKFVKS